MGFRKDFVWGAATASYQIEGAAYEDGKGRNIWDEFSCLDGKILDKSSDITVLHPEVVRAQRRRCLRPLSQI